MIYINIISFHNSLSQFCLGAQSLIFEETLERNGFESVSQEFATLEVAGNLLGLHRERFGFHLHQTLEKDSFQALHPCLLPNKQVENVLGDLDRCELVEDRQQEVVWNLLQEWSQTTFQLLFQLSIKFWHKLLNVFFDALSQRNDCLGVLDAILTPVHRVHDAQKAIKNHFFAFKVLLIVVRAYETTKQRNNEIPANRARARLFVYRSVGLNQPLEFGAGHLPSFVILAHV